MTTTLIVLGTEVLAGMGAAATAATWARRKARKNWPPGRRALLRELRRDLRELDACGISGRSGESR